MRFNSCPVIGVRSMTASGRDLLSDCGILKIRYPISGIILKLLHRQNKVVLDTGPYHLLRLKMSLMVYYFRQVKNSYNERDITEFLTIG